MSSKPRCLALAVLALASFACTTDNPAFGDGGGKDESTSGASVSGTLDGDEETRGAEASSDDGADSTGGDTPFCGNGVQESGEQCDQGEQNHDEGACQPDCTPNECGDGKIGPGQPCDDGPDGSATCTPVCTINVCGDGYMLGSELCDDGNPDDTDFCVDGCHPAQCGDGFIQAGVEGCDDENNDDFDDCLADCTPNVCGDGFWNPDAEQCDGIVEGSCANLGFDGGEPTCSADCNITGCTICGDATVEGAEECEPEAFVAMSCETAGFVGEGAVTCNAETCGITVSSGDCCAPEAVPCPLVLDCCGSCDEMTQLCVEG